MHIVEHSIIDRPASKVWPFIIAAEYFQLWNTKIISLEAKGQFLLNQPFMTRYRMNGKEMQCISTVTALENERLLEIQHTNYVSNKDNSQLSVCERITLKEWAHRTIVTKDVEVKHHQVPWILIPLIWLTMKFGKPVEPDKLKQMCEANA
ncbi:MAG: hypothetical protein HYY49_04130 [Ignavibacteriales bacterium]|nr:hypothetical protein [Ignavibacteriales bacterium]